MKQPRDPRAFVMGFVHNSKHFKSQFLDKWREILSNFVVDPDEGSGGLTRNPYSRGRSGNSSHNGIVLKDGETHKVIMTYASKLVGAALGDSRAEYVQAEPVGYEDAQKKAPTVSRLLRYAFSLDGVYRSLVESVTDMMLFGTSVVEIPWRYQEREMLVRSIESIDGIEVDSFSRQRVVAYDDIEINPIDIQDFFPDPSEYILEKMSGVVKRFRMNAMQARGKVGGELGYTKEGVERAIAFSGDRGDKTRASSYDEDFREDLDQPRDKDAHPDFKNMVGYEYWGEVPWEDDQGVARRVVTVLNNVVVRDIPYPLADESLPFRSFTINPVVGRFYGISPAEVIRYDQDFQDAVKILLAEAIIRQVHPPLAYDPGGDIDLAKLKTWSPDVPIPIQGGPNMIGTVKYDAGVYQGFSQADRLKQSMQETSGAVAALQGQELGSKRMSATEAGGVLQSALDRPELAASLLERDSLPKIGKSILRRYQQFLRDTTDLQARVGELPEAAWIGDIQGEFDVRFVGSRMAMSRQQKLQAFDRLVSYASAVPGAAALMPNIQILQAMIGDVLELPEVAAMIGDPQQFQLNMLMQQMGQQGANNNNGVASKSEPAGAMPAQVDGGTVA